MRQALQKPGGKAWAWAVLALVWAVALIVAAVFVPVYSTEGTAAPGGQTVTLHAQTFVHVNGVLSLIPVALPALLAVVVYASLHHKCARGGWLSGYVAWTFIVLLLAFCVVTSPSIGLFVLPVAGFLSVSASRTPAATRHDQLASP